jgi:hypothetical protein
VRREGRVLLHSFLDANVPYPAELRILLMHLAMTGLFRAKWSEGVHEAWIPNDNWDAGIETPQSKTRHGQTVKAPGGKEGRLAFETARAIFYLAVRPTPY